jgi:hypothetical protein
VLTDLCWCFSSRSVKIDKKLWLLFLKDIFEALVMLTGGKNENSCINFHGRKKVCSLWFEIFEFSRKFIVLYLVGFTEYECEYVLWFPFGIHLAGLQACQNELLRVVHHCE